MQFKDWLKIQETAGDSWLTPTAQPVARIYANYYGSALDGVLLPNHLPVDHKRQKEARESLQNKLNTILKNKNKYKNSDADHGDLWDAFDKQYKKERPRLPRPQDYDDAPDQYVTADFMVDGEPDWGTINSGKFKPMPYYR